jgi:hypothetical protein
MTDFFDKLRTDRKLDESLKLAEAISDVSVSGKLKAMLALHFADVPVQLPLFESVVSVQPQTQSAVPKDTIKVDVATSLKGAKTRKESDQKGSATSAAPVSEAASHP